MKKSTHRPSQPSSTNLPARAESDRETATGDNGCLVFLAAGVKGGGCAAQNGTSHNFKPHGSPHETFARIDLDGHRHPCLVRHASRPGAFAKGLWRAGGGKDSGDAGSRRRRSLAATSTKVPGWIRSLASRSRTANNGNAVTQGLNRSRRCDRALRRAAWVRKTRGVRRRIRWRMSGPLPFAGLITRTLMASGNGANRDAKQMRVRELDVSRNAANSPVRHTLHGPRCSQPQQLCKVGRASVMGDDFWISHADIKHHV